MERSSPFVDGEDSTRRAVLEKPVRSPGVSGTARRDRNALNAGGLAWRGSQPRPDAQGRKPRWPGQARSRTVRSTGEGGESRWREGALLEEATPAGKDRRLWRH